jgi:D-cysteine desulfhydrase
MVVVYASRSDEVTSLPRRQRAAPMLPRVALSDGAPTPVRRLSGLEQALGRDGLWIKDDGQLGAFYGGSKLRKLELVLADALARGARTLITFGGTGSNHCLATALFGRRLGLDVVTVLLAQPASAEVDERRALLAATGAQIVVTRGLATEVVAAIWQFVRGVTRRARPRQPYVVAPGGSSPLGCVGMVDGALELAAQIEAGLVPEPRTIVVPFGSGGTTAGLVLGLRLAGLASRVVAVQVSDFPGTSKRIVVALARRCARLVEPSGQKWGVKITADDFDVISDRDAIRYGHATAAGLRAQQMVAELEGVELDATYTAKAVAAIVAHADLPRPLLYWHTLNARPLTVDVVRALVARRHAR